MDCNYLKFINIPTVQLRDHGSSIPVLQRLENIQNKQKRTEDLHLCSVSELPSSFSLFGEFKERIRLSKEILGKQNNSAHNKAKLITAVMQRYRNNIILFLYKHASKSCLLFYHQQ